jgi:RNA polymerase sigma-70 factor (ECF subfamily)
VAQKIILLAEDVFQEISVKAVGRAAEFESPAHVLNWSRVAGRNRSIDLLRARGGRYVGLSEAMLATLAAEWPDQTEASPMHEALRFCLGSITPNNRELLRLRYFEQRNCTEVATIMGKKIESVYQALTRIHRTLGECVKHRMAQEASS